MIETLNTGEAKFCARFWKLYPGNLQVSFNEKIYYFVTLPSAEYLNTEDLLIGPNLEHYLHGQRSFCKMKKREKTSI